MGRAEVREFLLDNNFLASDLDMDKELDNFLASMQKGLSGQKPPEAMRMIPTFLTLGKDVDLLDPVIVLDAGGTNFRICLAHFMQGGNTDVSLFRQSPMPGVGEEISKQEFYDFIIDHLEPYLEYSKKIAFCFSYPCEILPNHDGRIVSFTKELRIPEAVDTVVGEEMKRTLEERGHDTSDLQFVLLNDTVAALLGGFADTYKQQYSGYASMVLGTGINSAYVEQNENIEKLEGDIYSLGNMIINMESGDYTVSERSDIDYEIDQSTNAPGMQILEKMISGKYLGLQALYTLKKACEDTELFSEFFHENFADVHDLEAAQLNEFLDAPYGTGILSQCCANELDRENVYYIIDNIFERAARLVTVMLCGIHIQMDAGKNPVQPLAITVEGTTFYKSDLLRDKIKAHVKSFINEKHGYYNIFLRVENANIKGSALASLMNEDED